jgi:hypothetical protein
MVDLNSSSRSDFARGLYVENDLPFRPQSLVFQNHVGVSRTGKRKNCADAGFQFTAVNEIGNLAQTLRGHFHQKEGCGDAVLLCDGDFGHA